MTKIQIDQPAIQFHLNSLQSVIQKMATHSSSMKTWCISLVSVIIVLVAGKTKSDYVLIAIIPIISFSILDSYYLALERSFRLSYNDFVDKIHSLEESAYKKDIFYIRPKGNKISMTLKAFFSFSTWPFYSILVAMVLIVKFAIL